VHVRGLDLSDRSGQALKTLLSTFLANKSGNVQEVMLIPDFERLLELEIERQHAVLMKRLLA